MYHTNKLLETKLMDREFVMNNPLILVWVGKCTDSQYMTIRQYWGKTVGIAFVQILSKDSEGIENNDVIKVFREESGELEWNEQNREKLKATIRRSKKQKFVNRGDANICFLLDDFTTGVNMKGWCEQLKEQLEQAYFNWINIDFYYLMREGILKNSQTDKSNRGFLNYTKELQKEGWIRFIFLLSEINSEELLEDNDKTIWNMVMDSIMAGNCSEYRSEYSTHDIFSLLQENVQARDSKLITFGRVDLEQKEEFIKTVIGYEFVKDIFSVGINRKYDFQFEEFNLQVLLCELSNKIYVSEREIDRIAYYDKSYVDLEKEMKNDILKDIFGNNHLYFWKNQEKKLINEGKKIVSEFCDSNLYLWISERTHYVGCPLLTEGYIEEITEKICEYIDANIEKFKKELDERQKKFMYWRVERGVNADKKESEIYFLILKKWFKYQTDILYYRIVLESLNTIKRYFFEWRDKAFEKSKMLMTYQKKMIHKWEMEINNSNKIIYSIRNGYSQNMEQYLMEEGKCYQNFYEELCFFMSSEDVNEFLLQELVDKHILQLYESKMKRTRFYTDWEKIGQKTKNVKDFYHELYDELVQKNVLQIRGSVNNISSYCCFLGDKSNDFINYIDEYEENVCTVYNVEYYKYPVVMYYQNIDSIEQLFNYYFFYGEHVGENEWNGK